MYEHNKTVFRVEFRWIRITILNLPQSVNGRRDLIHLGEHHSSLAQPGYCCQKGLGQMDRKMDSKANRSSALTCFNRKVQIQRVSRLSCAN